MSKARKRVNILIGILFFSALLVWVLYRSNGELNQNTKQNVNTDTLNEEDSGLTETDPNATLANDFREQAKQLREQWLQQNTEIEFFGRVVGQDGNGIDECLVLYQFSGTKIPINLDESETFEESASVLTNPSGNFVISGIKGRSLRILEIEKNGYIFGRGNVQSFTYGSRFGGRHRPSQASPVVFQMAKIGSDLELFSINERVDYSINPGKSEFILPIQTTSSLKPLELKFSFKRSGEPSQRQYGWSYSIELINGNIKEARDGVILLAPENGYVDTITQSYEVGSSDWSMRSEKSFYLKSDKGLGYAGIRLKLFSYHDDRFRVVINGYQNPNGRIVVRNGQ